MTEPERAPLMPRLYGALLAQRDGAWLAAFRILFGLAMCASTLRFVAFGWVDAFFVEPAFHFKYYGFSWVEPLPGPAMHALVWALAGLSLLIALGLWFRFAAWAFAIGFAYLQLIDVATYLNHYYLANLLAVLLALSPAHRLASMDALRVRGLHDETVASYWQYLFRFQVGVVYTFAGLAKAQADWLLHAMPLRIWLGSKTGLPLLGWLFGHDWAAPLLSWAGFLFDTGIVWLLLWRRTRPFAYGAVIVFHAMTSALFPIGMFPVIMILSALVFFAPDWPRRLLAPITRTPRSVPLPVPLPVPARLPFAHALIAALTLAYCALHLAAPLRHFVYPGSVLWHEQGMRWSWRVMVREKNGSVTFHVRDKRSGREWQVTPRRYLTRQQEQELSGQPDLILQLAHHVREEFTRRAGGPVEVRVDALVSLNGRRARALIDPNVDLGAVFDGVLPAAWITAAPTEPPPHIHPI
jgi:vitamin K-dependent gamma-carboxylase